MTIFVLVPPCSSCLCMFLVSLHVSRFPLIRTPIILKKGHPNDLILTYFFKYLISKYSHILRYWS